MYIMKINGNQWKFWTVTLMMCLFPLVGYSMILEEREIPLEGSWIASSVERSLFLPFTAYYDESNLTIQNKTPEYSLTITLTDKAGSPVYTMEVSQENSAFITIPLDGLGGGEYCLTISHPEAGCVYGIFNL